MPPAKSPPPIPKSPPPPVPKASPKTAPNSDASSKVSEPEAKPGSPDTVKRAQGISQQASKLVNGGLAKMDGSHFSGVWGVCGAFEVSAQIQLLHNYSFCTTTAYLLMIVIVVFALSLPMLRSFPR
jgi:hypothetical protein